ncbi:hypothetical protein NDU88_005317 [Pleurodeles waltl]|uniref:Uncharacterized protein n=1 Tax=Pleurodeles waltl TaxID=8319 RepID=A0AAV7RL50_PLEWA|nr:hypothetical protein NDU88_005317 [Pleurodeles waltl]
MFIFSLQSRSRPDDARVPDNILSLPGYTIHYRHIRDSLYYSGNADPDSFLRSIKGPCDPMKRFSLIGLYSGLTSLSSMFIFSRQSRSRPDDARVPDNILSLPGYTIHYRHIRDSLYYSGNADPGRWTRNGGSKDK